MKILSFKSGAMIGSLLLSAVLSLSIVAPVNAQQESAKTLDELLSMVRKGKIKESRDERQRIARFMAEKKEQAAAVAKAKQTRTQEEQRSARLEKAFEENKETIAQKREALKQAKGELTELFGHINSTAGDMRENFTTSLTSVQYPDREQFLTDLIEKLKGDALPTISEIEQVWFELQREMIASGKIVALNTKVSTAGGEEQQADVVRIGT